MSERNEAVNVYVRNERTGYGMHALYNNGQNWSLYVLTYRNC